MRSIYYVIRWYARRATGRCPSCGQPSIVRGSLCPGCADYPEG